MRSRPFCKRETLFVFNEKKQFYVKYFYIFGIFKIVQLFLFALAIGVWHK